MGSRLAAPRRCAGAGLWVRGGIWGDFTPQVLVNLSSGCCSEAGDGAQPCAELGEGTSAVKHQQS